MPKQVGDGHADRDHAYLDRLQDVSVCPIFVCGDHRTGTTVLYRALQATGCFNIVTAYHILRFDEILYDHVHSNVECSKQELNALFDQRGLRDRGFDRVAVSADTPEEYGFILKNGGPRPQLRPSNVADLVSLCKKIQWTSDPTRLLLLKNPWDCLNFVYVKEAFPNSKFIFVHRNPLNTINSQLNATRSLFRRKNQYVALVAGWYDRIFDQPLRLAAARFMVSPCLGTGLRITTRHVTKATDYFMDHVSSLAPQDYVCVQYEDFCRAPRSEVLKVLSWFGLAEQATVDYASLIRVRTDPLLREVEKKRWAIYSRMKEYFGYCGYELGESSGAERA